MAAPFVRPPPDRRRHRCESSPGGLGVGAAFDGNLRRLQDIIKSLDVGKGKTRDAVLALSKDGIRLLHAAACQGHLTVCKFLMKELGGDINIAGAEDDEGCKVLHHAAGTGCCKAGADVNGKGTVTGAIPNIPDGLGWLPVEHVASRDCREGVEMLFPLISPIPNVPNWSVDGIISHAKVKHTKQHITNTRETGSSETWAPPSAVPSLGSHPA
uniref:Uncharacterized protein n=1 Tax=Oryza barthii TaxID=65489 RepID=A0A0D3EK73_9ORYZ